MKSKINNLLGNIAIFFVLLFSSFLLVPAAFAQNSSSSDASEQIPTNFYFPVIKTGSILRGDFNIKLKIPYTQNIEVNITPENSDTPIIKSGAKKLSNDEWSVSFSLKNIPDGNYYLSIRMTNVYGQFETGRTKIVVDNSDSNNKDVLEQKDIDEWIEETTSSENYTAMQQEVNDFMDSMLTPKWLKRYFNVESCSNHSLCGAQADPDNDELVNLEEFRLGTNPVKADTDGDGYTDGDEIKNGYDPLKPSPDHTNDKINFESPINNGQVQSDVYKVLDVAAAKTEQNKDGLALKGTGLPNSFVNIYIYSSPTILTVKTDNTGSWSYTLDKEIGNGKHQVYVAVTDNAGKVTAKSEPVFFVKSAQAVNIIPPSETSSPKQTASPIESRQTSYFLISIIIAGFAFLVSLIIIGIKISKGIKKEPEQIQ